MLVDDDPVACAYTMVNFPPAAPRPAPTMAMEYMVLILNVVYGTGRHGLRRLPAIRDLAWRDQPLVTALAVRA